MKVFRFSDSGLLVFLLTSFASFTQLQALKLEKERFDHVFEMIDSVTSILELVTFASWVTKLSTVVVPFLSGVSAVMDAIIYFMDLPTPEMVKLKSGFIDLNYRLDTFSVDFEDVKNKIDWSAMQMSYEKYETIVRIFTEQQAELLKANSTEILQLRKADFIWRFEHNFDMAAEVLFNAMTNETSFTGNVFEAAGRYADRHPELTFRFMQGCTQLLMQAMLLKGTYIHLKYNNTSADKYYQSLATELMQSVAVSAKSVYYKLQTQFQTQIPMDVKRFAVSNRGMSHKRFSNLLFQYLKNKYLNRYWLAVSYSDELKSTDDHAVNVCGGVTVRIAGRNVVVASQDKAFADRESGWSKSWALQTLKSVERFKKYRDPAKALLEKVSSYNKGCQPAAAIVVLKLDSDNWYATHSDRNVNMTKEVFYCHLWVCMVEITRYYKVILFG